MFNILFGVIKIRKTMMLSVILDVFLQYTTVSVLPVINGSKVVVVGSKYKDDKTCCCIRTSKLTVNEPY